MVFDVSSYCHLTLWDFRVLTAIELGERNHEYVPLWLIDRVSGGGGRVDYAQARLARTRRRKQGPNLDDAWGASLEGPRKGQQGGRGGQRTAPPALKEIKHRGGSVSLAGSLSGLVEKGLVCTAGGSTKNRGACQFRLSRLGRDLLALHALERGGCPLRVGAELGCGKEGRVRGAHDEWGRAFALKLHRLGQTSFRSARATRDWHDGRTTRNWAYLSSISAKKERAALLWLRDSLPVPLLHAHSRHILLMEHIEGTSLVYAPLDGSDVDRHCTGELGVQATDPAPYLARVLGMIKTAALCGMVHGDVNEWNVMVRSRGAEEGRGAPGPRRLVLEEQPAETPFPACAVREDAALAAAAPGVVLLDWPQWTPSDGPTAAELYDRDVDNICDWFERKWPERAWGPRPRYADVAEEVARACAALRPLGLAQAEAVGKARRGGKRARSRRRVAQAPPSEAGSDATYDDEDRHLDSVDTDGTDLSDQGDADKRSEAE